MATYSRKFGAQTSFLLKFHQNKHDKDCGTSFDVAILIKHTGTSFEFRKLKPMIQNCEKGIAMI